MQLPEATGTMMAFARLNRGVASEEPGLGHARDSGQIEQDADTAVIS